MTHPGRTVIAAVGVALVLPALTSSPASADPPPAGVTVEVASVTGNGCPAWTVRAEISDARDRIALVYGQFAAQVGGISSPRDARKNCQVLLKVNVPRAYTYAIRAVDYTGLVQMEPGVTGTLRSQYHFRGPPVPPLPSRSVSGPYSEEFYFTETIDPAQLVYKPCGEERDFLAHDELRLDLGTSDPSKTSSWMHDQSTYHLAWKSCA
ncbi:DUF4360 domain-containing protein [Actinomadura rubrisoli]|uniref:DUF4360 domain-containing protein n=1 Tax=Actinomadura rubrisoli TaxID=2530368 RepID=A0A4R5BDJ5_9ACTN|nr:DUF4360 domain-containing protein [Actinomadura rubrisoli]TDD84608.1 DUF4360 domain-containing protein [Actinomadura rubrisoli]